MRIEEFTTLLTTGAAELGIHLTERQVQQFFFICTTSKNGTLASIWSAIQPR